MPTHPWIYEIEPSARSEEEFYNDARRYRGTISINGESLESLIGSSLCLSNELIAEYSNSRSADINLCIATIIMKNLNLDKRQYETFMNTFHQGGPGATEVDELKARLLRNNYMDTFAPDEISNDTYNINFLRNDNGDIVLKTDFNKMSVMNCMNMETFKSADSQRPLITLHTERTFKFDENATLTRTSFTGHLTVENDEIFNAFIEIPGLKEDIKRLHERLTNYNTHLESKFFKDSITLRKLKDVKALCDLTSPECTLNDTERLIKLHETFNQVKDQLSARSGLLSSIKEFLSKYFGIGKVTGIDAVVIPAEDMLETHEDVINQNRP